VRRLGALWRELRPDRNPLRRACDRAEAALAAGLLAALLIGVPAAAVFAGVSEYRTGRAQQASWHRVPAVLLAAAPDPRGAGHQAAVLGTWTVPHGTQRVGRIVAPAGTPAGRRVTLWVDASGRPIRTPQSRGLIIAEAIVVAVIAAAAVSLCLLCIAGLARWALTRRRLAAWDTEWQATGPQWTSQP
jgi:hypothetical protein